ncbi:NADPH-dependent F420 reductase [Mycobacterium sp. NPDC003449]
MRIGVVNAGNIGRTLSRAWLAAGHELFLAKEGRQDKLDAFVEAHPQVQRGTLAEAADFGEVVLFSVYWPRLDAVLEAVGPLSGKVVIETMNPLQVSADFEHSHDKAFMAQSSTTEELQRRLPDARVVKAFNTMPSDLLDNRRWAGSPATPSVFIAGANAAAKKTVAQLAEDAGFPAIDAGPLVAARSIEQLGLLTHYIGDNHFGGDLGRFAPAILTVPAAGTQG